MAGVKAADMCLGCGKKLKKSETSVQCTVCSLWCHKECAGISNEFIKFLEEQKRNTGLAYWGCRPCTVYAQGINHRLKEVERRLDTVEESSKKNEGSIARVEKKVEKIGEKIESRMGFSEDAVFEEMREREAKWLNVIMHGVQESDAKERSGEKRIEWDMKEIEEIFKVLELSLTREDVKFCRRVGEKGDAPRALIVGFHTEYARSVLLRYTRYLADTEYEDVSVMPDLTKRQRQEELTMKDEAERRNEEELTEDDLAKNLCWKVVGQRGEKRLVKGFNRETAMATRRGRGRGTRTARPARGLRGMRGQSTRGAEKGKRTRNSSDSDHEHQPLRKQRGGNSRGTTRGAAVITGANRTTIGARNRQETEPEIQVVQEGHAASQGSNQEEEMEEETEETITPSQMHEMGLAVAQPGRE
jgi:hypothetical protein